MTLEEHLGDSCRAAKITVYLEGRMSIEKVGVSAAHLLGGSENQESIRRQGQLVVNQFQGMVAVKQTSPETYFPSHAPACGHVTPMHQGSFGRLKKLGCSVRGYLTAGIQRIEMRHMAMVVVRVVDIINPFLHLAPFPYLKGSQAGSHLVIMTGCLIIAQKT